MNIRKGIQMSKFKRVDLVCDRISNKQLFKAVVFAITMIRDGTYPSIANSRAAKYYGFSVAEVAKYVGQHSARIASSKRNMKREFNREQDDFGQT